MTRGLAEEVAARIGPSGRTRGAIATVIYPLVALEVVCRPLATSFGFFYSRAVATRLYALCAYPLCVCLVTNGSLGVVGFVARGRSRRTPESYLQR